MVIVNVVDFGKMIATYTGGWTYVGPLQRWANNKHICSRVLLAIYGQQTHLHNILYNAGPTSSTFV